MTTSSWDRSRRVTAAASVLTVLTAVAGAVILALGMSVPEAWWPHTGHAFAAAARPSHQDPCARIVGPAKTYCQRGAPSASAGQHGVAQAAWRLVPVGAGLAALVVWRRRSAAGQGRR